ncbi:Scr1 family TA system antitoxin-like transcriptional regulator [Streptomyces sp. NPDC020817]|uniref:Scr1 family TA system antitoxin-like transcriptional regulator n=1 Tax=Streptomyces sp. NPDC020817 TaxID=3365095 RepID=UPI00379A6ADC
MGAPPPLSWTSRRTRRSGRRRRGRWPGISLQVLPLGIPGQAGLNGPFALLETPEHQHSSRAETQRGSLLGRDRDELGILTRKCAGLRSQALNFVEKKGLLDRLSGER